MAKEKLFTPEDFDKPEVRKKGNSNKLWAIIGLAVVVVVVIVVALNQCQSDSKTTPSIIEEPAPESVPESAGGTGDIVSDTATDSTTVTSTDLTQTTATTQSPQNAETVSSAPTNSNGANATDLKHSVTTQISEDVETEAFKVIRGDYGNVPKRKELLGSKFQPIQDRVNQLKKEGVF
jgi:cytoskeletal protein RodZ